MDLQIEMLRTEQVSTEYGQYIYIKRSIKCSSFFRMPFVSPTWTHVILVDLWLCLFVVCVCVFACAWQKEMESMCVKAKRRENISFLIDQKYRTIAGAQRLIFFVDF